MLIKKSITFGVFLLFNTIYLDIFSSYAILILLLLGRVSVEGDWERHDLLLSHLLTLSDPRTGSTSFGLLRQRLRLFVRVLIRTHQPSDCVDLFSFRQSDPRKECPSSDWLRQSLRLFALVLIRTIRGSDEANLFQFTLSEGRTSSFQK